MLHTVGIDVGSSSIKTVLCQFDDDGKNGVLLKTDVSKIRKRDIKSVIHQSVTSVLQANGLTKENIAYIATTGEGEMVDFARGHFYSMTAHARGALFLNSEVRAVVDMGALHCKVLTMDERSKVLSYRMTGQCASGSGQFLENISRYLGIAMEEIGEVSIAGDNPEIVSNICAVLAETDVINMVSRGISPSNILKGIHLSMGRGIIRLMRALKVKGKILVTGGLARDAGLVAAMQELADKDKMEVKFITDENSILSGAIGTAFWGAFRHVKLLATESSNG